jgi:hypothetical protein
MSGAVGRAAKVEDPTAFQDAIDDGLREVGVVEDGSPGGERFVGGEDHRLVMQVAVVDDMEEKIGGVVSDREVADLIDDEDVGMGVESEMGSELSVTLSSGERFNEVGRAGEERFVAVLDGAVSDGDGEVGLARAAGAGQDQRTSLGDELGTKVAAEKLKTDGALEGEVEVLDRTKEGEVSPTRGSLDARLSPMRHLLGHEQGQEVTVGELVVLRPQLELRCQTSDGGEMQAAKQRFEFGSRHHATSRARERQTYWAPKSFCSQARVRWR